MESVGRLRLPCCLPDLKGSADARFDQRIEVERVGKVEKLIAQPADLRAGRQGDGQGGVEHGAAGLWSLVGVAGQAFQFDAMVDEKLAQLVEDIGAEDCAHIGHIRQGLRAAFQRFATNDIGRERMLREPRQRGFHPGESIPATTDFQNQCAALAMARQASADDRAAILVGGAAEHIGQLHRLAPRALMTRNCSRGEGVDMQHSAVVNRSHSCRKRLRVAKSEGRGMRASHAGLPCQLQAALCRLGAACVRLLAKRWGALYHYASFYLFRQEWLHDCGQYGGAGHAHGCAGRSGLGQPEQAGGFPFAGRHQCNRCCRYHR